VHRPKVQGVRRYSCAHAFISAEISPGADPAWPLKVFVFATFDSSPVFLRFARNGWCLEQSKWQSISLGVYAYALARMLNRS
jgi:hypothetical protein